MIRRFECRPLLCCLAVMTVFLFTTLKVRAANITTLYSFTGGTDGGSPYAGVVQDASGVLYGATGVGGDPSYNYGTIFSFSRTTGLKTLVNFTGANGGGYPSPLLLRGTTLYGASGHGAYNDGVIFSVHTDGSSFTLLHQFSGAEGSGPTGAPSLGSDGTLYGITFLGGPSGQGVLFSIKPDGTYAILHAFTGGADGAYPTSLLMSPAGVLVGSTSAGGASSTCAPPAGCGGIFSYAPSTAKFGVLYTVTNINRGEPLLGSIGPGPTVYGTTETYTNGNGIEENDVFALSPRGYQTVGRLTLYQSGVQYPGPTLALDGSLLVTDGSNVYDSGGNLARIKNGKVVGDIVFGTATPGYGPSGQPVISTTGSVIGTTYLGGLCSECGAIYEVKP